MQITKNINDKIINIFYNESNKDKIPVIILNTYDEDGISIWKETNTNNYILVTISNIDWNNDMSPWYMNKLYQSEDDYLGKADEYLNLLTNSIIPNITNIINNELHKEITEYIIAGYSLAGLFALYSIYKTNIFNKVISCSGSLWYPNFTNYVKENNYLNKPKKIYFSLGNKESNTKNELLKTVKDKTIELVDHYKNIGIDTIYEENIGNHFQDVTKRIAKGINWILK